MADQRCGATTTRGSGCRRKVSTAGERCAQHSPGARLRAELTDTYVFSAPELRIVDAVCETVDTLDRLDARVADDGVMSEGHKGQPVLHPAVREARQQRLALSRLLGQLDLPDDDGQELVPSLTSVRARKAANARWAGGS